MNLLVNRSDTVEVQPRKLLEFFDEAPPLSRKHATAVVSVGGEELGIALILHYLERRGIHASVIGDRCTPGTKTGVRLDAWIEAPGPSAATLYQVEVKNWSAHAIGGQILPVDAPPRMIAAYAQDRWKQVWDGHHFADPSVAKVLHPMKSPRGGGQVEPLICFWWALHPTDPLFSVDLQGETFPRVWVFSMSLYLRQCTENAILLRMPKTCRRLQWLSELFVPR